MTLGSTYRLQLNGIGFAGAAAVVPALHRLGVQTLYLSPVARARAESTHGYDVVDPNLIDPALGGQPGFERLLEALGGHGMRALVDIVPNHMAVSTENPYFADVLRFGSGSRCARYFDVSWDEQEGRIALPILDRPIAELVDAGEARVALDPRAPDEHETRDAVLHVAGWSLPLAADGDADSGPHMVEACDPTSADGRRRTLELLAAQHYLLVEWSVPTAVNYRRFFDINDLIGVRQEDPEVFEETHRLIGELARDPRVAGFRVDHVDGLRDPEQYLHRLRELTDRQSSPSVILVEKILAREERLPGWPVEGTTGYEAADLIVGVFVDSRGADRMTRVAARASGDHRDFSARASDGKRMAAQGPFLARLDHIAGDLAEALAGESQHPSRSALLSALTELTVALPVYRTYRQEGGGLRPADATVLQEAAVAARSSGLAGANEVGAVLEVLTGPVPAGSAGWRAVGDWQQVSGAVAAKGVEDTALYDAGRPLACCDVGADPARPGRGVREFHTAMRDRLIRTPGGLTAGSTHDSKRSNDVRCRLAVLTEASADWEHTVAKLDRCIGMVADASGTPPVDAADRRYVYETLVGAWPLAAEPDQMFVDRIRAHLVKAAREAKRRTNWAQPDVDYEDALGRLAETVITGVPERARDLVAGTVRSIEQAGATNSLASIVIGSACPGVPDTYQRDQRWFLTLVDPDNRVPMDLDSPWLGESEADPAALLRDWRTGSIKEHVLARCLQLRRYAPELFADGRYLPVRAGGSHRRHVVAFARERLGTWVVAAVPRLAWTLTADARDRAGDGFPVGPSVWAENDALELPAGAPTQYVDVLTGREVLAEGSRIPIATLLGVLPVVLLRAA
jgi:malto-oligosyltrehalose synthase